MAQPILNTSIFLPILLGSDVGQKIGNPVTINPTQVPTKPVSSEPADMDKKPVILQSKQVNNTTGRAQPSLVRYIHQ